MVDFSLFLERVDDPVDELHLEPLVDVGSAEVRDDFGDNLRAEDGSRPPQLPPGRRDHRRARQQGRRLGDCHPVSSRTY
jgi:hypothetical protein